MGISGVTPFHFMLEFYGLFLRPQHLPILIYLDYFLERFYSFTLKNLTKCPFYVLLIFITGTCSSHEHPRFSG